MSVVALSDTESVPHGADVTGLTTTTTEQVWSDLHAGIRAFVQRRVRHADDVDDIVQRVFMQVHRALPSLREADRLHAWVYQTTRRAIADHSRDPAQRRERSSGGAIDLIPDDAEVAVNETDGDQTVLGSLAACLHPLLNALAAGDQQALQLVEFEGVTQAEAARRLGLSVSGMKSRVQRARGRLKLAVEYCCRIELDRRGGIVAYETRAGRCGGCGPHKGSAR